MGPIPINDKQIPPQPPSASKVAKLGFWSKKMRNVLKPMKKRSSDFYFFEKCLILYSNSQSYELRKKEIFWVWKILEQNYFSSQWIKSQKMVRIMKTNACEICIKIEEKKCQNSEIEPDAETLTSNTPEPVDLSFNPMSFIEGLVRRPL